MLTNSRFSLKRHEVGRFLEITQAYISQQCNKLFAARTKYSLQKSKTGNTLTVFMHGSHVMSCRTRAREKRLET